MSYSKQRFPRKRIPDPVPVLGKTEVVRSETANSRHIRVYSHCWKDSILKLSATSQNTCWSVHLKRQDPEFSPNPGGKYNPKSQSLISKAAPGDNFLFQDIKCKCPVTLHQEPSVQWYLLLNNFYLLKMNNNFKLLSHCWLAGLGDYCLRSKCRRVITESSAPAEDIYIDDIVNKDSSPKPNWWLTKPVREADVPGKKDLETRGNRERWTFHGGQKKLPSSISLKTWFRMVTSPFWRRKNLRMPWPTKM